MTQEGVDVLTAYPRTLRTPSADTDAMVAGGKTTEREASSLSSVP